MADLLRSGYTMLNIACPVCNNPVFRNKEGEKFCPSCNRKVVVINDQITQNLENKEIASVNIQNREFLINKDVLKSLNEVILKKLQWITEKLETETQLELIKNYTDILTTLYDLLNKITYSLRNNKKSNL
ncbi:MAG: Sjogren's syndrome/scleroderma autoantigen 1 family protein [Promethearchaeota archaeon]